MPTTAEILSLLSLDPVAEDHFLGGQPETSILDKVYGGQLFAQALQAATATAPPDRRAHVLQASCLEPGHHGAPVDYAVERVRDGRSFSLRAVTATQQDRPLLRALVSFHVPEPGLTHRADPPLDRADPASLPPFQAVIRDHSDLDDHPWWGEWEGIDIRYDPAHIEPSRGSDRGRQALWMRTADPLPDDEATHRLVFAYLSDLGILSSSLLPHGMVLGAPLLPRATLNHTIWLHAPARADEWLLFEQSSPWAGDARGFGRAEVYDRDGRLIASLAQEGLIRPRGELRERYGVDAGEIRR